MSQVGLHHRVSDPDCELVLVWSAVDVDLGATNVEYYPATGRLIVYGEDGDLLDTELPITE